MWTIAGDRRTLTGSWPKDNKNGWSHLRGWWDSFKRQLRDVRGPVFDESTQRSKQQWPSPELRRSGMNSDTNFSRGTGTSGRGKGLAKVAGRVQRRDRSQPNLEQTTLRELRLHKTYQDETCRVLSLQRRPIHKRARCTSQESTTRPVG